MAHPVSPPRHPAPDPEGGGSSPSCLICGAPGATPLAGFRYGEFRLFSCRACGVSFVDPIPSPGELEDFYRDMYHPPHRPAERNRSLAGFAQGLFRRSGVLDGRLLDFGAGEGAFAQEMVRMGHAVSGLELSDLERAKANAAGITTVRDLAELPRGGFSAVLARHVVEHLPAPLATLKALRSMLAPGGRLVVGVPNFGSTAARLLRDGWEWFAPPAHLSYFDRDSLAGLVRRAGFEPVLTETTQGDAVPLPVALAFGFLRSGMRRAMRPGFWKLGPGQLPVAQREAASATSAINTYLAAVRLSRPLWPWGDEELWMACRVA